MKGETYRTSHDPALEFLQKLLDDLPYYIRQFQSPIKTMTLELRFFKMFSWRLVYWAESKYDWHLRSTFRTVMSELSQTDEQFIADSEGVGHQHQEINWEEMSYELEKRIKQFKPQIKEICVLLINSPFKCKFCQPNQQKLFLEYARETASFIDFIRQNLKALLNSNIDLIAPVKQQIDFIQWKLEELSRFANPTNHSITRVQKLSELVSCTRTWASHISCLACLYWIDGRDESLASTMGAILSDLMYETMPYTPGVIASYLEGTMIPQLLASYFDFLLQDLVIPMNDDMGIIHERLIFLLSFVMDPPKDDSNDRELILAQIYAIINELSSFICSICFDEMKEGISKANFSGFLKKIDRVEVEIKELYVITPYSSQFNSPKTNVVGFLDSFFKNLKEILEEKVNLLPFIKYQLEIVQKELELLRPFLQSNIGLQNEHGEFKNIWTRTVDMVYYAAFVTKFCFARSFSVWYGIASLENLIEDIKLIKTDIKKIEDHKMYKNEILCANMESDIAMPPQATTAKVEGAFIGFNEEARSIIDYLMRGQKDLTIISISGMPGQGKTTLAKKIYNDPSIQHYFLKSVWSYVSKECTMRELLIKILCGVTNIDYKSIRNLQDHDLAERLWKSLRRQRYLIVMDDIWDVDLWRQVQGSFPDDCNGSRILFTSRNHDLASQAKPNSISHCLRLFSNKESWELMKEKIFHCDGCPPQFLEIGEQIASYCKGLPLAVVLIAGLLGRIEQKLDLWKKVVVNLKLHLASEGCNNIIELSYRYLPDYLRPCFLYFGAFPRGERVSAKKLKLLWIAEGFIKDNEMQPSEDLANGYLNRLVSQSLVVVAERSSMGGIKSCNVHDLLYDLCSEKGLEENFLQQAGISTIVVPCNSSPQKFSHHRLCISRADLFIKPRPICTRKDLPTSQVHSCLCFALDDPSRILVYDYRPQLLRYESSSQFLKSFKAVTVLDLEGVSLTCNRFPEVILSIIHLRHLALNFSDTIAGIPQSIAGLGNLETLIVEATRLFDDPLPNSLWKMKGLRHLSIRYARLHLEDFEENSFAAYNIKTLGELHLVYDSKTEEFLKKLPKLKKLACYFDKGKVLHSLWFSMLGSLTKLESLKISRSLDWWDPTYKYSIFKFPMNLKKLTLHRAQLSWSVMSAMGKKLPNLEVLKLTHDAIVGFTWNLEDGDFSKLRYLKLNNLGSMREIDVSGCDDGPFPCLEQLVVEHCRYLKEIPSSFGEIYTLKTIRMTGISRGAKKSVKQILEYQQDMGNCDLQVFYDNLDDDHDDEEDEEIEIGEEDDD